MNYSQKCQWIWDNRIKLSKEKTLGRYLLKLKEQHPDEWDENFKDLIDKAEKQMKTLQMWRDLGANV